MNPVPVLGWDAPRAEWLAARRQGLGASEVAAILGFSSYADATPWAVWAEKTGRLVLNVGISSDQARAAAELGTELEPWLIAQAPRLIGKNVARTPHQLYRHPEYPWRVCSPDAFAEEDLVEGKTSALLSRWTPIDDWLDGGMPLGYEFQCRWQMHIMNRRRVYLVGLVAGLGLVVRVVERDMSLEYEMVEQVSTWWHTHVVDGEEPPVGRLDAEVIGRVYSEPDPELTADLAGTDAAEWCRGYLSALAEESQAAQRKDEYGARLKALLGNHCVGVQDGRNLVTWNPSKGRINWEQMARDMAAQSGVELPDPELYRGVPGRTLSVKKVM